MFDRDAILAATDLAALADELLGSHRGTDRSPRWRCPNPDHRQTGRTPPVTAYRSHDTGEQRWRCHGGGCGIGGTAIDLVIWACGVDARTAIKQLAQRADIPELPAGQIPSHRRRRQPQRRRPEVSSLLPQPVPELERYVADCAQALWQSWGEPVRRWLTETRHLPDEVVRLNRIGVDLGPRHQDRPDGVPEVRRAVVLPVLADGQACYVQLRTLNTDPDRPKYLSCAHSLAPNPRLGFYHPARSYDYPFERTDLLITEGIIDALSAAAAGYTAAAYLGADLPDRTTAAILARHPRRLIIAFDHDAAGRSAAYRLSQLLRERGRDAATLELKSGGDLNACLVRSAEWPLELAGRIQHAAARLGPPPRGPSMTLG